MCVCVVSVPLWSVAASHSLHQRSARSVSLMPAVYAQTEFQHGEPHSTSDLVTSSFLATLLSDEGKTWFCFTVCVTDSIGEEDVVCFCAVDAGFLRR